MGVVQESPVAAITSRRCASVVSKVSTSFGEPLNVDIKHSASRFQSIQRTYSRPVSLKEEEAMLPFSGSAFDLNAWLMGRQQMQGPPFAKRVGLVFDELNVFGDNISNRHIATVVTPFYKVLKNAVHGFGIAKPFRKDDNHRQLLHGMSGIVADGEMLLVLGRPGAGCSTLLRVLGNRRGTYRRIEGHVSYGGLDPETVRRHYRGEVAYNQEDDVHFPTLTVRKTLEFAIQCKMPSKRMLKDREGYRHEFLDTLLDMYGLAGCADTIVGNAFLRGVSGGERKRVSIAEQVALGASVDVWDGSTRGLDSSSALDYVRSLRITTDVLHKATVVTIYQASENIYDLFDKVMVVDEGRQLYFGPVNEAVEYFRALGIDKPLRQTRSDFLTGVTQLHERRVLSGWEYKAPKNAEDFERAWLESSQCKAVKEQVGAFETQMQQDQRGREIREFVDQTKMGTSKLRRRSPYTTTFFFQLVKLFHREWEIFVGERSELMFKIIDNITFASIIGTLFLQLPHSSDGAFTRGGLIFFAILFISLNAQAEMPKTVAGRNISPNIDTAYTLSGVSLLVMILNVGYLQPPNSMHPWFKWLYWINPLAYGFKSLMCNEFRNLEIICTDANLIPNGINFTDINHQVCTLQGAIPGERIVHGRNYLSVGYQFYIDEQWIDFVAVICFWFLFVFLIAVVMEWVEFGNTGYSINVYKRLKPKVELVTEDAVGTNNNAQLHANLAAERPTDEQIVQGTTFTWRDTSYTVPVKGGERQLLDGISGYIKPGTMTALMGASGAGKTTLLDALSQRKTIGKLEGEMLMNGAQQPRSFCRITGYCEQIDVHNPHATVREALRFSAYLRQPASVTIAEKDQYVERVIFLLGLTDIGDCLIGEASSGEGISLEERKRLTIGVELVSRPKILFLDEPTSGLDAQASFKIVHFLRRLAAEGQTILCTIHQPSAMLFEQFDRLLLLVRGGHTVYFGDLGNDAQTLINYFERNGAEKCAPTANPAEYILDVVGEGSKIDWPQIWNDSKERSTVELEINYINNLKINSDTDQSSQDNDRVFAYSHMYQTKLVTRRMFLTYWRNIEYNWTRFALQTICALMLGFTFWNLSNDAEDLQNKVMAIFMTAVLSVLIINQVQPEYFRQRQYYYREASTNQYGWRAFAFAIIVTEWPFSIVANTLFFVLFYWTVGLNGITNRIAYFYLLYIALGLFSLSLGQAIASFSSNDVVAAMINPVFTAMSTLFCGVPVPYLRMPKFWRSWMYWLSPYMYYVEGVITNDLYGSVVNCKLDDFYIFNPPKGQSCGEYAGEWTKQASGYINNLNGTSNFDTDIGLVRDAFETNVLGVARVNSAVTPSLITKAVMLRNHGLAIIVQQKQLSMACLIPCMWNWPPFGLRVVVVAPGTVKSNLGTLCGVSLPEKSPLMPAIQAIRDCGTYSLTDDSTPPETLAKVVVPQLLSKSPRPYITYGRHATMTWLMYYLPMFIRNRIYGHHLAIEFAASGCKVYASARNIDKLCGLEELGISLVQLDVTSDESVHSAVAKILSEAGQIDILVNNAGLICAGPVVDTDIGLVRDAFETNVLGVARVSSAVTPGMITKGRGLIVNVGSVSGYAATPWVGYYCATKAALHTMSDAMRMELAPFGLRVVVVAPGAVKSNLASHREVSLSHQSPFLPAIQSIRDRATFSQTGNPTPPETLAKVVVPQLLSQNPRPYITYGRHATMTWLMYYLPMFIRDFLLARRFGTHSLAAGSTCPITHQSGSGCPYRVTNNMRNLVILSEQTFQLPTEQYLLTGQSTSENYPSSCVAIAQDVAGDQHFLVVGDSDNSVHIVTVSKDGVQQRIGTLPVAARSSQLAGVQYLMERETVVVVLESGELFTIAAATGSVELVGAVDAGITGAAWSPDEEVLALVTCEDRLLLMTQELEVLAEVPVDQVASSQHVALGWGSTETQYHGRGEGKVAEPVADAGFFPDDKRLQITWRGDGAFFAVSRMEATRGRELRVYTREGVQHSTGEETQRMGAAASWRPSGRVVAMGGQAEDAGAVVNFVERNGKQHGRITLGTEVQHVAGLAWNSDSTVLAVVAAAQDGELTLQLWTESNYAWRLKLLLRAGAALGLDDISHVRWDTEDATRLLVAGTRGVVAIALHSIPSVAHAASADCNSAACVINGARLLHTPLAVTQVPPPMALHTLPLSDSPTHVAFSTSGTGNDFIALLADRQTIVCFECDAAQTVRDARPPRQTRVLGLDAAAVVPRQVAWPRPQVAVLLGMRRISNGIAQQVLQAVSLDDGARLWTTVLDGCVDPRVLSATAGGHVLVAAADGQVFTADVDTGAVSAVVQIPAACVEIDACETEHSAGLLIVGRTVRGHLYAGTRLLSTACLSFFLRGDVLLYTTSAHELHVVSVDVLLQTDGDVRGETRRVERGAVIVVAPGASEKEDGDWVVLQMPRGNIETVRPRALVLAAVRRMLQLRHYRSALVACRRNRIDMNFLCDYLPEAFAENVVDFVTQINDSDLLSLFISGLRDEDVTHTMYSAPGTPTVISESKDHLSQKIEGKTTRICHALREAMLESGAVRHGLLPAVLTTLMCQQPPDIAAALKLILPLPSAERDAGLTHLLFLADVDPVYDAALGIYELPLALLVAQRSQRDPREFLPLLSSLHAISNEEYRRYRIDALLNRNDIALEHLCNAFTQCVEGDSFMNVDELWSELVQFVKSKELFQSALYLLTGDAMSTRVLELRTYYAEHLAQMENWSQAAAAYLAAKKIPQAVSAFIQAREWRTAMGIAGHASIDGSCVFGPQQLYDLAIRASELLSEHHEFREAAAVLLEYTQEDENAVELLVRGSYWAEAMRCVAARNRADLMETTIRPGIMSAADTLRDDIMELSQSFTAKHMRLKEVRAKPIEELLMITGANHIDSRDENVEVMSDTASMTSQFTTFSMTNISQTTGSTARRISKSRRKKEERKKIRGKKGSIYEESHLVESLARTIDRIRVNQTVLHDLNLALMLSDSLHIANELQNLFTKLVDNVLASVDWIFDQQHVRLADNPIIKNEQLSIVAKPVLPTFSWKLNCLE
ncbi:IKI3-domain-containing protein [Coemansia reversa NRRL 1564]|uniref:IKI3-domain-containing protein n=1 Tax=Coemansia reversa (strain ATCC 12441 / NRRL 1564) TaxID=763665 RepID=A0A2G5B6A2_COERN|nr:IKI3-domain-containing protein [Coemansia reversa NRRL 1564]|eukprot:PIA14573.1 IKI3-domain-containing protein [Coemansia reversa NRRL 1564]